MFLYIRLFPFIILFAYFKSLFSVSFASPDNCPIGIMWRFIILVPWINTLWIVESMKFYLYFWHIILQVLEHMHETLWCLLLYQILKLVRCQLVLKLHDKLNHCLQFCLILTFFSGNILKFKYNFSFCFCVSLKHCMQIIS